MKSNLKFIRDQKRRNCQSRFEVLIEKECSQEEYFARAVREKRKEERPRPISGEGGIGVGKGRKLMITCHADSIFGMGSEFQKPKGKGLRGTL